MTEKRKTNLALDGVVYNIVSECRNIVNGGTHVYDGIEKLESLIQEYNILQKTYKITSEDEMHGLADKFIQRIQERLS